LQKDANVQAIISLLSAHKDWFVLTGAGVSAASGVPTYRNSDGIWQRKPPVTHQEFMAEQSSRRRFWSRNMVGWRFMIDAQPNSAHLALVKLQQLGLVSCLVTQNVDGLHQRAGSKAVIDLHGRVDSVSCMACGHKYSRASLQTWLETQNPEYALLAGGIAPDGDADIDHLDYSEMQVPDCEHCGGILKPDAVFYGDSVPKDRLLLAEQKLRQANGLVVAGSSLMTYSGYRFCLWAQQQGKPIVLLNEGKTRADDIATLKIGGSCAEVLQGWLAAEG
jgi:NAD-dependent SIR2 family protein deacetylase